MSDLKTKKNDASVANFIASIEDEQKRQDAQALLRLMQKVTGEKPKMWGASIVGFGEFHYRYASGREGDWLLTGFSPRAQNLTVYVMTGFAKQKPLLAKLGKHSTAKSCLYIRRLADVDAAILERIVEQGIAETKALGQTGASPDATPKPNPRRRPARATGRTSRA
jgi:hypothetical protein